MNVEVVTRGSVDPALAQLAEERVAELESGVKRPIIGARVVLQEAGNPRIAKPARAEGELRLAGSPIRGRVEAETMTQAVNDLVDRLREQLRRHADRLVTRRRLPAGVEEGEWRRDDGRLAVIAPQGVPAVEDGGDIVRETSRYSGPLDLADAVGEMDDGHYGLIEPAA